MFEVRVRWMIWLSRGVFKSLIEEGKEELEKEDVLHGIG